MKSHTHMPSQQAQQTSMDYLLLLQPILAIFFALFLHQIWLKIKKSKNTYAKEAPEPGRAIPVIGHLHLLSGSKLLHHKLAEMADVYGPAFTLRLGRRRTLVISNWELAKECFTTNDKNFANRPRDSAAKLLGYDLAMIGFAPYGPYWRETRRIATLQLLSNRRLESLKHVRSSEVDASIREIYELWKEKERRAVEVNIQQKLLDLTFSTVVRMVAGKRFLRDGEDNEEGKRFRELIEEQFYLAGTSVVSDAVPILEWVDFQGTLKSMRRVAKEVGEIVEGWVSEHRRKRATGETEAAQDFIDVLLSLVEDGSYSSSIDPAIFIKANVVNLVAAATDTTAITMTWALSLLLNNRHALRRAQAELDLHVGKDRNVDESDVKNLTFLDAIVKETLRLYPAGPLLVPHEAIQDCHVGGFNVYAGTRLVVNAWKLQRDPRVWSDPERFDPDRFLTSHVDIDVWGKNYEFLPFGSGRRSCPGISFALHLSSLTLARFLHAFEWDTPFGECVDMTEGFGLTLAKATPLRVVLTPRLPSHLYQ
ncbi:hypothetical protein AMTRI_Chr13g124960 [Amborella trichopoda]